MKALLNLFRRLHRRRRTKASRPARIWNTWLNPFRHLRWKLTLSYTLVTVAAVLALEIAGLSALVFLVSRPAFFTPLVEQMAAQFATQAQPFVAYEPTSGRAVVAGFDLSHQVAEARAATGYVPQRFSLYTDLTPTENLEFFSEAYGMSRAKRIARTRELLGFVGLTAFAHRRAEFLSGGMKQKLSLACALIHRPRVLLLDEPTGGVDPVARQEFWRLLYTLLAEGSAILISTPYMDEASRCHRVGLMNHGRLMAEGTPHEIVRPLGGHILELAASPQRIARQVSRAFPGVADVQVFGDRLHLRVADAGQVMEHLPGALTNAGVQITHLRPTEPVLEDVFTQLLAQE